MFQASLLMLSFPLAYVLLFIVSLIRIIYDFASPEPIPVSSLLPAYVRMWPCITDERLPFSFCRLSRRSLDGSSSLRVSSMPVSLFHPAAPSISINHNPNEADVRFLCAPSVIYGIIEWKVKRTVRRRTRKMQSTSHEDSRGGAITGGSFGGHTNRGSTATGMLNKTRWSQARPAGGSLP